MVIVVSPVRTGMGTMVPVIVVPVIVVIPVSSGAVNMASVRRDIAAAQSDHYQAYNQYQFLHDPPRLERLTAKNVFRYHGFPVALRPAVFLRVPFTAPTF